MTKPIATILMGVMLGTGITLPVQAQGGFGTFFGGEQFGRFPERFTCLTDYQVRQAVAGRGYTNIFLNVMNDKHVEVRATRDGWVYLLDFNYCTGRIVGRTQLRPAR
jgi:hypothetical protein